GLQSTRTCAGSPSRQATNQQEEVGPTLDVSRGVSATFRAETELTAKTAEGAEREVRAAQSVGAQKNPGRRSSHPYNSSPVRWYVRYWKCGLLVSLMTVS